MHRISIPTPAERRDLGKKMRDRLARQDQREWKAPANRDPLATIRESNEGRVPKLVPMKMHLMSASPFAYFRGTAPVMAKDLACLPVSGLTVQMCGDAHVKNLGAYAAPDGALVFDINDFDETISGPWEWDLKRLATSVVLAGADAGDTDCEAAAEELAQRYRESMAKFSRMKVIDLAKYRIRRSGIIREVLEKAERVTPERNLKKLTEPGDHGLPRFHDNLPTLRHVPNHTHAAVLDALERYRATVTAGRQLILDAYHPVDAAFKIVGTGSVGTRDFVVLLIGNGKQDPMFLQVKEEMESCYAPYVKPRPHFDNEGRRVAQGQQRMQTVVDPFLGWTTVAGRGFLVRQLADHKAAINPAELKGMTLRRYAVICGEVLAKAHARTGDAAMLNGYCGESPKLDKAIATFAMTYAEQVNADYRLFMKAIKAGKIKTATLEG
jgi:uncharacterized protein (DUF2252 family)